MKFKKFKLDIKLLVIVLSLLAYGLTVLYSASAVESFNNFGNTTYYITHQLFYGCFIGLVAMFVMSKIDYHIWQKYLPIFIFGSLLLLLLVKVPGIGFSAGGATRWIHVGPVFFQPAELAKLVIIFYLASWVDKKRNDINNFYYGLMPSLIIICLFAGLILLQPDFGTMLVLVGVATCMLFTAGVNLKLFFYGIMSSIMALFLIIKLEPYRMKRVTTFFNPSIDPKGISYQINQALLAIGSGGYFGFGYGLSRQKHSYLPEVMNDSIFAVFAEELGFVRVVVAILIFALFMLYGFKIAKNAPDLFGKMLAVGIVSWISLQAVINIAAILSLVPLTGIPLPFFSYGSTALIVTLTGVGILFNISAQSKFKT